MSAVVIPAPSAFGYSGARVRHVGGARSRKQFQEVALAALIADGAFPEIASTESRP